MPLKLRTPKNKPHRVTPTAVAAFIAQDWLALYQALDLRPWMPHPMDIDPDTPDPGPDATPWEQATLLVRQLRRELEDAAKATEADDAQ